MTVSKETRNIVGLTLITVLIWFAFEIYTATTSSTVPNNIIDNAKPINPNIDIEFIKGLSKKLFFSSTF